MNQNLPGSGGICPQSQPALGSQRQVVLCVWGQFQSEFRIARATPRSTVPLKTGENSKQKLWGFSSLAFSFRHIMIEFLCSAFEIGSYFASQACSNSHSSSCLCLPNAGLKGVRHHTQLNKVFLYIIIIFTASSHQEWDDRLILPGPTHSVGSNA